MKSNLEEFIKESLDEFAAITDDAHETAFLECKLLEVAAFTRDSIVKDIQAVEKLDYYCECEGDIHFVAFTREGYDSLIEKLQEEY